MHIYQCHQLIYVILISAFIMKTTLLTFIGFIVVLVNTAESGKTYLTHQLVASIFIVQ